MDGFRRTVASLLSFAVIAAALPVDPASASSATLQRLKGTISFTPAADGKRTDVTTTSPLPDSAEAFAGCSSLAVVTLADGAQLTIGGKTQFVTPSDTTPATLEFGALEYDIAAPLAKPLRIATQFGTVAISQGSGWIVAGQTGAEAIVRTGRPNDVSFSVNKTVSDVPPGQSLVADVSGKTTIAPIATVNNSATYQFNDGRNPLGTDQTALYLDPTGSPAYDCSGGVVGAGAGAGALALLGLGAAGAAVVAVTSHGGGSNTPTPSVTPTPSNGGTPTPIATTTAPTPTPVSTSSLGPSSDLGPVLLNPASTLLSPGIGSPAESTFTASQTNYTGPFTVGQPVCPVSLLGAPSSLISGNTITVGLPSQLAALALFCSVTVTGGGGMSATEPIDIDITALGPSPAPTNTSGFGPVVPNPTSVLLNPGIGSAASQTIAVTQKGYTGPFSATITGCLGLGAPPSVSVSGSNVVFSLPAQLVAVDLGCSVTITGGGGQFATVPVTISIAAIGTPTASPTSSGSAGDGPLTASPQSILLSPSVGAPATQNIIVLPSAEGPFTATTTCSLPIGSEPLTSTTGNVVTVTAPAQVLTAPIACSTVIVSTVTGNSVTVPVLITATGVGGAVPTPSPNPTGFGPLFAIPGSILINPGITEDATQNIEIYDHGFTGTYKVGLAPGCLALQQPGVTLVNGNIAAVTVPGQLVNVALLCDVTISDGTNSIEVPVTISATALAILYRLPHFGGMVFNPPSLSLSGEAEQTVRMLGPHAPYSASASCPAGTELSTAIQGELAVVHATSATAGAQCMLTIRGAAGAYGEIPVRIAEVAHNRRMVTAPAHSGEADTAAQLVLRDDQEQTIALHGSAPFALSGSCGRVADATIEGGMLRFIAHHAGTCSLVARGAGGSSESISLAVEAHSTLGPMPGH